jgi:hypothetical protein
MQDKTSGGKKSFRHFQAYLHKQNLQFYSPVTIQKSVFGSCTCRNSITVFDGQTSSKSCKQRWCLECNSARFALRANHYMPHVPTNNLNQFTTTTVPNVQHHELKGMLEQFKKFFRDYFRNNAVNTIFLIKDNLTKDFRTDELHNKMYNPNKISAIVSIECTMNTNKTTWHIHAHIIHSPIETWIPKEKDENGISLGHKPFPNYNKENKQLRFTWYETQQKQNIQVTNRKTMRVYEGTYQEILYQNSITKKWLETFPNAKQEFQKVIPLINLNQYSQQYINENPREANAILEVFKYSVKPDKKETKTDKRKMYQMLGHYYATTKNKKLFQTYNLNAPPLSEKKENELLNSESKLVNKSDGTYNYSRLFYDYVNKDYESLLDITIDDYNKISKYNELNKSHDLEGLKKIEQQYSNNGLPEGYGMAIKYNHELNYK